MIRVAIEGTAAARARLERMLSPRFEVTAFSDDEPADVVIAFELLRSTATPLLILADDPTPEFVFNALRNGARGVLPSDVQRAELGAAIEAVAEGLLVIHPQEAEALLSGANAPPESAATLAEPLTPREIEVLQLLSLGVANKEIAARLNISEHTVKFHVASLMGKLGAGTRTEAVTIGLRLGLILL